MRDEVLVLPTAAAYEHPGRAVETAEKWFSSLGGRARGLMVLRHAEANDEANAAVVRRSPLHLPVRRARLSICSRC